MKPLELTTYETDDETGRYVDTRGYTYAHEDVEQFGEWKRLTEAELAAEWHYANMQFHNAPDGTESGERMRAEFAAIHRFASTPHYFEDPA